MVAGVDVWLNNPRRPLEASGTSGQKVPINGGVNFSVLDGWWPEGYNGQNGWVIGKDVDYSDHTQQDYEDGLSMYHTLEEEIIPLFYDRGKDGIPKRWIRMSKESLRSTLTKFSTHTMLWNYTTQYYVPGMKRSIRYSENNYASLFNFTRWINRQKRNWKQVRIKLGHNGDFNDDHRILGAGETKEVSVKVRMNRLKAEELRVELILERQDAIHGHRHMEIYPMGLIGQCGDGEFEYRARVKAKRDGSYRFNCRVIPTNPDLFNPHETRLIKWLD
jgi:starch phosphorylase